MNKRKFDNIRKKIVPRLGTIIVGILIIDGNALAAPAQTGQGIMVEMITSGDLSVDGNKVYKFNEDSNDGSLLDVNGDPLTDAAKDYFTNTMTSGPVATCSGNATNCADSNKPNAPTAPEPDPTKVSGPSDNDACSDQKCTFLAGGTLSPSTYDQSAPTINGLNGRGNWTFTWTYTVTPKPEKDIDVGTDGVQVAPYSAWYLFQDNSNGTAAVDIDITIAGESVVKNNQHPTGKYSFSMTYIDAILGELSRVTDVHIVVKDSSDNTVAEYTPSNTVVKNDPGCGADGFLLSDGVTECNNVDFCYVTNAGSNGVISLLRNGDARSILNGGTLPNTCDLTDTSSPDVFVGNNNGGADGSALSKAVVETVTLNLGAGDYTVELTAIVKGNNGGKDIPVTTTGTIHITTPGCNDN